MNIHDNFCSYIRDLQSRTRKKARSCNDKYDNSHNSQLKADDNKINQCVEVLEAFSKSIYNEDTCLCEQLLQLSDYFPYLPEEIYYSLKEQNFPAALVDALMLNQTCTYRIMLITKFIFENSIFIDDFIESGLIGKISQFILATDSLDILTACYSCIKLLFDFNNPDYYILIAANSFPQAILKRIENYNEIDLYIKDAEMFCISIMNNQFDIDLITCLLPNLISCSNLTAEYIQCVLAIAQTFFEYISNTSDYKRNQTNFLSSVLILMKENCDMQIISIILSFFSDLVFLTNNLDYYSYANELMSIGVPEVIVNFVGNGFDNYIMNIIAMISCLSENNTNKICQLDYLDVAKQIISNGSIEEQVSSCFLITSILKKGNNEIIELIVEKGLVQNLLEILDLGSINIALLILDSLEAALYSENECYATALHHFLNNAEYLNLISNIFIDEDTAKTEELNCICERIINEVSN